MSEASVWMNAATAAQYLDMACREPAEAFRVWAKRHGVPTARRGSRVLYARADIDRAIGGAHLQRPLRRVG